MMRDDYRPTLVAAEVSEPTGKTNKQGAAIMKHRFGIHCLRHHCASQWISQRTDLKRVQTWLGHSTIELTMDRYGHLMIDQAGDAAIASAAEAALFG